MILSLLLASSLITVFISMMSLCDVLIGWAVASVTPFLVVPVCHSEDKGFVMLFFMFLKFKVSPCIVTFVTGFYCSCMFTLMFKHVLPVFVG